MKCTCVQCGKSFELSDSEIDYYRKKNLHLPKRCKDCRQKNKQKQGMASAGTNGWKTQNQYDVMSGRDKKKIGKWIYGVIVVAALLLVLGIKVSLNALDTYIEDQKYSAEATQNDSGRSVDTGQSESVSTIQSEQNKVANTTEPILNDSDEGNIEPEITDNVEPEQTVTADVGATDPIQDSSTVVIQYYFRNAKLLEEHYQKHGIEMGFASAEEYQAAASAVVINENSLHKLEAEDGDDVYYLEATNDFVIVSTDGYIRTYFRPDSGINYYNKQ